MEPPPPQAVPQSAIPRISSNLAVPSSSRPTTGASPTSYGAMTGISFTNGGGFSFEESRRNGMPIGSGATPKSYKRNVSGSGMEMSPYSTSINMEPMSFSSSAQAFGLGSIMSSSLRRSYAAAVSGSQNNLASSFASMSFQPQSLGTSYSRRQVHSLMLRSDNDIAKDYNCCGIDLPGIHALMEHVEDMHPEGMDDMSTKDGSGLSTVDNAIAMDMELEDIPEASGSETRSSQSPKPTGPTYAIPPSSKPTTPDAEKGAPFSPTSAWLKSEVLVSPANEPPTAKSTQSHSSSSTPPDGSLATPTTSQQHSPVFTPKIATARGFVGTGVGGVTQQSAGFRQQRFERAFNDVVTGKKDNKVPDSVAPGMLFAAGPSRQGIPTVPAVGRNGQPAPPVKESDPPLPAPSLFSPHKPWRCPTPGCNKAYKQSNGLKYHQQKG